MIRQLLLLSIGILVAYGDILPSFNNQVALKFINLSNRTFYLQESDLVGLYKVAPPAAISGHSTVNQGLIVPLSCPVEGSIFGTITYAAQGVGFIPFSFSVTVAGGDFSLFAEQNGIVYYPMLYPPMSENSPSTLVLTICDSNNPLPECQNPGKRDAPAPPNAPAYGWFVLNYTITLINRSDRTLAIDPTFQNQTGVITSLPKIVSPRTNATIVMAASASCLSAAVGATNIRIFDAQVPSQHYHIGSYASPSGMIVSDFQSFGPLTVTGIGGSPVPPYSDVFLFASN
eukprot:TRINITY_DN9740_c0_g1_i1.p1 TRINITY_DN9740_c0_g1~~TRINITY_DN9740_c0_g1_i1.p1  ORF type:complete len:287 (-),score=51.78 TRINITY_DN9740_c0_g1_i1:52-912(-)